MKAGWVQGMVMLTVAVAVPGWAVDETSYLEPQFGVRLFDGRRVSLEMEEREEMADGLVKTAYYLSDQPVKSAEALALADAFVPGHSGTRVANFRMRRGFGPSEVQMIVVDDLAEVLLRGAARMLEPGGGGEEGLVAAGYVVDIVRALPVEDAALRELLETLDHLVPPVSWAPVFAEGEVMLKGGGD